jgi:hypothetical protein
VGGGVRHGPAAPVPRRPPADRAVPVFHGRLAERVNSDPDFKADGSVKRHGHGVDAIYCAADKNRHIGVV